MVSVSGGIAAELSNSADEDSDAVLAAVALPPPRRQSSRTIGNSCSKLSDALAIADRIADQGNIEARDIGIFAQEVSPKGARRFYVDTFASFCRRHAPRSLDGPSAANTVIFSPAALPDGSDHLYEIIRESKRCCMYFDLEFPRVADPTFTDDDIMSAFVLLLDAFCKKTLGLTLCNDMEQAFDCCLCQLDASTAVKFSRHVILRRARPVHSWETTPCAVVGPEGAGAFAAAFREFVSRTARSLGDTTSMRLRNLASIVFSGPFPGSFEEGGDAQLIDMSVYSANRNFRLAFSSKYGQQGPLLPLWEFAVHHESTLLLFQHSMVSWTEEFAVLLDISCLPTVSPLRRSSLRAALAGQESPAKRSRATGADSVIVDDDHVRIAAGLIDTWAGVRVLHEPGVANEEIQRDDPALYKLLSSSTLSIALRLNRFCLRKGCAHKSNGVCLVYDMFTRTFHQRCFDASDCMHFKSRTFVIGSTSPVD